jgi:O-antigen/teichoic acid export membrane protein
VLPPEMTWSLVALAVAAGIFLTAGEHFVVVLEAAGRMRLTAGALVLRSGAVTAALAVVTIIGVEGSPELVIALTTVAGALLSIGLAAAVWRLSIWPPALDRVVLRRMLLFSLPLIAFSASQYGMRSVDIVILRAFEPTESVGVYAVAFQAFVMLSQLATTLTIVLTPLFVSLHHAGRAQALRAYLDRLVPQVALLIGIATGLAGPLAALLVPVVLGEAFAGATDPLVVLLAALWLQAVASLAAPVLLLFERSRATAAISMAALAVNVAGDLLLIGAFGIGVIGPAIASVAAVAVIAAGYLLVAGRSLGVRPRFPLAVAIAPIGGMSAALALPSGWALLGAVAAGLAGLAVAVAGGLFARADTELLGRLPLPGAARRALVALLRLPR